MSIARQLVLLALLTLSAVTRADYVFMTFSGIERFSDSGEYIGPFIKGFLNFDPETEEWFIDGGSKFIDESIDAMTLASDGRVFALGNGLGIMSVYGFDPQTDSVTDPRFVSSQFEGYYDEEYNWPNRIGISGSLLAGLQGDGDGSLWGFGRIIDIGVTQSFNEGWALVRMPVEGNSVPEVMLQLGPPDYEIYTESESVTFADVETAFISTSAGLIEFDYSNPSTQTLWNLAVSISIANGADPWDSSQPFSPLHQSKSWMHPLAGGNLAGTWEYGADGLLRNVQGLGPSSGEMITIESYDPVNRQLLEPVEVNVGSGEMVFGAFFREDGVLMLLTKGEGTNQRLLEVDPLTGALLGVVFDIETSEVLGNDFGPAFLAGGLYVPPVPEPSAAVLFFTALFSLVPRRANLAVR